MNRYKNRDCPGSVADYLFLADLSSAQDELLWSLFVRRPSVCASVRLHFQTTSPLKLLSQFCSNFIWSLLRVGEWKIAKMVAVRWPRWPPRPYMVKTFKNLLLQNRECLGAEPLQESLGTGGLPKLLKELSYVDVWPFYGKVKFASQCRDYSGPRFLWEKKSHLDKTSEIFKFTEIFLFSLAQTNWEFFFFFFFFVKARFCMYSDPSDGSEVHLYV